MSKYRQTGIQADLKKSEYHYRNYNKLERYRKNNKVSTSDDN